MRLAAMLPTTLVVLAALGACGAPATGGDGEVSQWRLPERLREISGLALTGDGRLLAVTDEHAVIYELDFEAGGLTKAWAVGPPLRGDFEGIAVLDDTIWLLESDGNLVRAQEGHDGERVSYDRYDMKLDDECEFEGLAADPSRRVLLLLCKESRKKKRGLRLFEVVVADDGTVDLGNTFGLDEDALGDAVGAGKFNASGIAFDTARNRYLVAAARQFAVVALAPDGSFIEVIMTLDKNRHRQAEGIEWLPDGRLLIADEGGNGRARLAVYRTQ